MAIRLTMRLGTAGKAVALDGAGKTTTLRDADHIHHLAFGKDVGLDDVA